MLDPEKGDISEKQDIPQDIDGPVQHPGISTTKDSDNEPNTGGPTLNKELEDNKRPSSSGTENTSIHSRASAEIEAIPDLEADAIPAQRFRSRSSSRARSAIVVPRSKRRGLLARLTVIPEVERPYDYKNGTKWFITFQVAIAAAAAPMGSAILLPALGDITREFHSTDTIANLSVALYMLSMSIFPLWWSSFSETLGRRSIYLTSFVLCTLFNIISAISTSMGMFIVMRMLAGGAAASVQAVGAGTIADIWEVRERGRAMGFFYLGPLLGPLLAPIIGGVLTENLGWRSTQWFQAIYGGVLCISLAFCLPETLPRKTTPEPSSPLPTTNEKAPANPSLNLTRTSTLQSVHKRTKTLASIIKRCFIDPLSVLLYLRFPAVLITVYLASITFGSLYILNISIQDTFRGPPYNFKVLIVGLLYIPNSLGYIFASLLGGRWVDHIMHREARSANRYDSHGKLVFRPEDRMRENAWIGAIIFPGALIWYGWSVQKGVIWIVPMIANFFFGVGSMIIFGIATTMLTEFLPRKSSSGVAVNNFVRNIFSCVGGVVASPIIRAIGNGWLFTIVGCVCWVSAVSVVWAMRRFGPRWRLVMDEKLSKS